MPDGNITSVEVTYPDDFTGQMLRYSEQFSFLAGRELTSRLTRAKTNKSPPAPTCNIASGLFVVPLHPALSSPHDSICFCLRRLLVCSRR